MSATKGNIAALRMLLRALFSHGFILDRLVCLSFVDLFYNLSDARINLFVCLNLFGGIDEKDVCSACCEEIVLLLSPAFPYSTFKQISLHGPFEQLLRDRNHDPVSVGTGSGHIQKPKPGNIPVLPFADQLADRSLAADPFLLRKGVRCL